MIELILWTVGSVYVLYVYYLAVMALRRAKLEGLIEPGTRQSVLLATVVLPGVVLDWVGNFVLGTVLFLELPKSWGELITGRLKRHCCKGDTWRSKLATFICHQMLDTFDPGGKHC